MKSLWVKALALAVLAGLHPACSKKDSLKGVVVGGAVALFTNEVEPNGTTGTATPIGTAGTGVGDLTAAGDVDCWSIALTAGQYISVDVCATRLDLAAWDAADNLAEISIIDTDGVTVLQETLQTVWSWGLHDFDIQCFRVPASGTYFICVRQSTPGSAGGEYAISVKTVTPAAPVQMEAEGKGVSGTNDTSGTAEAIVPGTVLGWRVDDEDDYYSFVITVPTIVYFEYKTYRNHVTEADDDIIDPELELYDTNGTTTLLTDDDSFFYDSAICFLITTPGTYYVNATECCGNGDGWYYLIFETTPVGAGAEAEANDTFGTANAIAYGNVVTGDMSAADAADFFSFNGTAGDMIRVKYFDTDNSEYVSDVTVDILDTDGTTVLPDDTGSDSLQNEHTILQSTGTFFVRITGGATTAYTFVVERVMSALYETEVNNGVASADTLSGGGRGAGVIATAGDVDYFRFNVGASQVVKFAVHAIAGTLSDGHFDYSGHGSILQPLLEIRNGSNTVLATAAYTTTNVNSESTNNGLATFELAFLAPAAGTFYVTVTDENGAGSADHYYVIERR